MLIDNKPGAGGVIGTDAVAKAPADGSTFLMVTIGHAVNPFMYAKLPYDTGATWCRWAWWRRCPAWWSSARQSSGKTLEGPAGTGQGQARQRCNSPAPASAAPATWARR